MALRVTDQLTVCRVCGNHIRFLKTGIESRTLIPFGTGNTPHQCPGPKLKVYTKDEIAEFSRKRSAGEI